VQFLNRIRLVFWHMQGVRTIVRAGAHNGALLAPMPSQHAQQLTISSVGNSALTTALGKPVIALEASVAMAA
jgi:hypothetical protein